MSEHLILIDCQNGLKENDATLSCIKETYFKYKMCRLKLKDGKDIPENTNQNEDGVNTCTLISEKVDFGAMKIIWDKTGHYLMETSWF